MIFGVAAVVVVDNWYTQRNFTLSVFEVAPVQRIGSATLKILKFEWMERICKIKAIKIVEQLDSSRLYNESSGLSLKFGFYLM